MMMHDLRQSPSNLRLTWHLMVCHGIVWPYTERRLLVGIVRLHCHGYAETVTLSLNRRLNEWLWYGCLGISVLNQNRDTTPYSIEFTKNDIEPEGIA
jgi:hypothetical protein